MMKKGSRIGAYMTVYLTLTMAVMVSLCLVLIEGTRANAIKAETECVTAIGLNSILAEYHRELFERYNLFAIDASYGTANSNMDSVTEHLQHYLEQNFSQEEIFLEDFLYKDFMAIAVEEVKMTAVSILTDEGGTVFRRSAVCAIEDDCNLTLLQELQQWMQVIEDNGLREQDIAAQKRAADKELQEYDGKEIIISDTEVAVVDIDNPTAGLEEIRNKGILEFVVEDAASLSAKVMTQDSLIMERMKQGNVNKGNVSVKELTDGELLWERFCFQEYLMRYMGCYGRPTEDGVLSYQIEYLLGGNDADVANLKSTVNILFAIREAANAIHLFGDNEKCAQAEAVAVLITTALGVPEASEVLKTVLLLGWSCAESLYDVETLLSGGQIPLIKNKDSWHYDIQAALGNRGSGEGADASSGLCYEDYLRLFMMFTDLDTLTQRAMNLVEADIRLMPGNSHFRLDNCYEQVEFYIRVRSKYGYEYEITRRAGY